MRKKSIVLTLIAILISSTVVHGQPKDVDATDLIEKMRLMMENPTASFKMTILTKDKGTAVGEMTAGVARKQIGDKRCILLVLLGPEGAKGVAYLFRVSQDSTIEQWSYLPVVGRVRNITGTSMHESFLGTDLNNADISFPFRKGKHRIIGEEEINGNPAYKIETIPNDSLLLYSRIVTWVDKSSHLAVRHDFYDMSEKLWKQLFRDQIVVINKTPFMLHSKMVDVQRNTSTEVTITEILTDTESITDEVFVPEQLKHSLRCPVWEKICYLPEKKEQ